MTTIGSSSAAPAPRLTQEEQARRAAMAAAERREAASRPADIASDLRASLANDKPETKALRAKAAAMMGLTLDGYEQRLADGAAKAARFAQPSRRSFASAGEAAAEGGRLVSKLQDSVNSTNETRAMLAPANVEGYRRPWGAAKAEELRARLEKTVADYDGFLAQDAREIADKFTASGTLLQRGEDGRWPLGAFALERAVGGSGVRIGSDAKPWVLQDGGPYQKQAGS